MFSRSGPGTGATTDVLSESVPRASDSLASEELEAHHDGDTYNPVDPSALPARLAAAGFTDVNVRTNEFGWTVIARVAA